MISPLMLLLSTASAGTSSWVDANSAFQLELTAADIDQCDDPGQVVGTLGVQAPIELMLVLDSSGSLDPADYTTMLDAATTAIDVLNLDGGGDRVGVVNFATDALVVQPLSASSAAAVGALSSMVQLSGQTNWSDAIIAGHDQLTANGTPGTQGVILVLTDGAPNRPEGGDPAIDALFASLNAQSDGHRVFAVGVGPDVTSADLSFIASPDSTSHFDDYDSVDVPAALADLAARPALTLTFDTSGAISPLAPTVTDGTASLTTGTVSWTLPAAATRLPESLTMDFQPAGAAGTLLVSENGSVDAGSGPESIDDLDLDYAGDCPVSSDPVADFIDDIAAWANSSFPGGSPVDEAGPARLRPSTLEAQLDDAIASLDGMGCTYEASAGSYAPDGTVGFVSSLDNPTVAPFPMREGALDRGARTFAGDVSDTLEVGSTFSAYQGFKHVANRSDGGFHVGRFVRVRGRRGVFVSIHGSCPSAIDGDALFGDWYGASLADWP